MTSQPFDENLVTSYEKSRKNLLFHYTNNNNQFSVVNISENFEEEG